MYNFSMKEKIPIEYEDDEILVINKPAGLAVQGGEGIAHPLDEELPKQVGYKVHLVHRLDKETCGLMVVAKNPQAASKWIKLIAGKLVKKEYTAICFGSPKINGKFQKSGKIQANVTKGERELPAETNFLVEDEWEKAFEKTNAETGETKKEIFQLSKINLTLGTGRMHQIRIHLASVGSPIVGDDRHGDFKKNKFAKQKRLLLCSRRLTIPLMDGKTKTIEIDLPDYFLKNEK
jgi:23S rRNA pseudouridine955/2504/2580 synthase